MSGDSFRGRERLMSRAISVDETIPCPRIRSGEAADRLVSVAGGEYQTVSASSDRIHFARTRRPTWALVTGIVLLPVIVGIPILLVKRTETWVAAIEEDHRTVQVHVTGTVVPAVMAQLLEALQGEPAAAPPVRSGRIEPVSVGAGMTPAPLRSITPPPTADRPAADPTPAVLLTAPASDPAGDKWMPPPSSAWAPPPVPEAGDVHFAPVQGSARTLDAESQAMAADGLTIARLPKSHVSPSPSTDTIGSLIIVFDTGERIDLGRGESAFVGRDPVIIGDVESARLIAIDDPALSISKTHLLVTRRVDGVQVMDLGSTNGTMVCAEPGSPRVVAQPQEPLLVLSGGTVRFGDRELVVRPTQSRGGG